MGNRTSTPENYVSSCGDLWFPVHDWHTQSGYYLGYRSAAYTFCDWVTTRDNGKAVKLQPGDKVAYGVSESPWGWKVVTDNGMDPGLNTVPASINFEIENKQDNQPYSPDREDCVNLLMKVTMTDSACYGKKFDDTKGGTFVVGDDEIVYRALGHRMDGSVPTGGRNYNPPFDTLIQTQS